MGQHIIFERSLDICKLIFNQLYNYYTNMIY